MSDELVTVLTCESALAGAHLVGALDGAAQVEHGEHGDDHHDTLKKQGGFKLLPDPARISQIKKQIRFKRKMKNMS